MKWVAPKQSVLPIIEDFFFKVNFFFGASTNTKYNVKAVYTMYTVQYNC